MKRFIGGAVVVVVTLGLATAAQAAGKGQGPTLGGNGNTPRFTPSGPGNTIKVNPVNPIKVNPVDPIKVNPIKVDPIKVDLKVDLGKVNLGKVNTIKDVSKTAKIAPENFKQLQPTYLGKDYFKKCGKLVNGFCCYPGHIHAHWSCQVWWPTVGCYLYWDPCLEVYFYYCVPDDCWYPVDYVPYGIYVFVK